MQKPAVPNGPELYNLLMSQIEPELTRAQRPSLKEKYKNETPTERAARQTRYNKAMATFEEQKKKYFVDLDSQISVYIRASRNVAESKDREAEAQRLLELEKLLSA